MYSFLLHKSSWNYESDVQYYITAIVSLLSSFTVWAEKFWEHPYRHHSISLLSKSFLNIFTEPKISNCKDQTINGLNIYLLFDLLRRQKSIL